MLCKSVYLILSLSGLIILCSTSSIEVGVYALEDDHPGESIYRSFCADCHGEDMQAFVGWKWSYGQSRASIEETITNGRDFGAMPAFGETLKAGQIEDLVDYLKTGLDNLPARRMSKETDVSRVYKANDFNYQLETVVSGMDSPWGMAFLPDGNMLVTEKNGRLYMIQQNGQTNEIFQVPEVNSGGQGGLMDILLHPNYEINGWIYLSYSISKDDSGRTLNSTAVSRYRLKSNLLVEGELIFEGLPYSRTRHHYGSRLVFDRDGYLFVTTGDRGARDTNPQSLERYPGKVHRLNDDGSIPGDNPFVDHPKAVKSIWSYGHRNAQGMSMHPITGEIWVHEHGPKGGDELNLVEKGANYGWPLLSYGINYNGTRFTDRTEAEGYHSPVHYWVPSIAPSGMTFVSGNNYPGWQGHLLLGSLKFEYLDLCKMRDNRVINEEKLMEGIGRVRDVKEAPDGIIYVSVEEPGRVYKIVLVE